MFSDVAIISNTVSSFVLPLWFLIFLQLTNSHSERGREVCLIQHHGFFHTIRQAFKLDC